MTPLPVHGFVASRPLRRKKRRGWGTERLFFLKLGREGFMSDGREEREERERRRELEEREDREDRIERELRDEWEPERDES